jgi:CBS domain-containing protein
MRAQDLMTNKVLTCQEGDSLERAAQLMWEGDVGALPVVDAGGQPIGMITDRDVCMAAYTQGCCLAGSPVSSAMSRQLYTCKPEDGIGLVEELMRRHRVRRIPVVGEGRLVGILSLNDLAVAAGNRKASKGNHIGLDGVATTLARVCEHRGPAAMAAE